MNPDFAADDQQEDSKILNLFLSGHISEKQAVLLSRGSDVDRSRTFPLDLVTLERLGRGEITAEKALLLSRKDSQGVANQQPNVAFQPGYGSGIVANPGFNGDVRSSGGYTNPDQGFNQQVNFPGLPTTYERLNPAAPPLDVQIDEYGRPIYDAPLPSAVLNNRAIPPISNFRSVVGNSQPPGVLSADQATQRLAANQLPNRLGPQSIVPRDYRGLGSARPASSSFSPYEMSSRTEVLQPQAESPLSAPGLRQSALIRPEKTLEAPTVRNLRGGYGNPVQRRYPTAGPVGAIGRGMSTPSLASALATQPLRSIASAAPDAPIDPSLNRDGFVAEVKIDHPGHATATHDLYNPYVPPIQRPSEIAMGQATDFGQTASTLVDNYTSENQAAYIHAPADNLQQQAVSGPTNSNAQVQALFDVNAQAQAPWVPPAAGSYTLVSGAPNQQSMITPQVGRETTSSYATPNNSGALGARSNARSSANLSPRYF